MSVVNVSVKDTGKRMREQSTPGEKGQASSHRLNNLVLTGLINHGISTCDNKIFFFSERIRTAAKEKTHKMASPGIT